MYDGVHLVNHCLCGLTTARITEVAKCMSSMAQKRLAGRWPLGTTAGVALCLTAGLLTLSYDTVEMCDEFIQSRMKSLCNDYSVEDSPCRSCGDTDLEPEPWERIDNEDGTDPC